MQSSKNRKKTTSSLGGLKHQKLPSLILQIILSISTSGDIIPVGLEWPSKHIDQKLWSCNNLCVTEIVISAGVAILDFHYTLRKEAFRSSELPNLRHITANLQIHVLRMFSLKQVLLNSTATYGAIKLHLIEHYPDTIREYGRPSNYDMVAYEFSHKEFAKNIFRKTSGRVLNSVQDMAAKVVE